jgi:uncharacterized protein (TIGR00645 family)
MRPDLKNLIQTIIFNSKWILIPFYLYLFWTLIYLLIHFIPDGHIDNETLLKTLEAVDVVMIANLVKMIITGSYNSFVDKAHNETSEQVGSGILKVKMSTSVMGVSSIHLLQTFIAAGSTDWDTVWKQVLIHGIFIIGSGFLAWIDYLHHKTEKH